MHTFALCVYVFCFWTIPFPDALAIMLPIAVLRDYWLYIREDFMAEQAASAAKRSARLD